MAEQKERLIGWTYDRDPLVRPPLMGTPNTRRDRPMRKVAEPCMQQTSGSCYGCSVMNEIYKRASDTALWSPRRISQTIYAAANEAVEKACPEGVSPQTGLLDIKTTTRGIGDTVGSVRLKRKQ
jgi:hypothetical protein